MEYALVHQKNLKKLIVCNMQSSIPNMLRTMCPPCVPKCAPLVDSLEAFEAAGDLQTPCTSTS